MLWRLPPNTRSICITGRPRTAGRSPSCSRNAACPTRSIRSTSARATSSSRTSWRSRPTTRCRRSSIRTARTGSRSRSSNPAPSCNISAARPASSIPADERRRVEVDQWLFWQMGGFGPMLGQAHHFRIYAPEKCPTPSTATPTRPTGSTACSNKRLADREFVAGDYSIADMAIVAWAKLWERQGQNIEDFPNVKRWLGDVLARPAVQRGHRGRRGGPRQDRHEGPGRAGRPVRPEGAVTDLGLAGRSPASRRQFTLVQVWRRQINPPRMQPAVSWLSASKVAFPHISCHPEVVELPGKALSGRLDVRRSSGLRRGFGCVCRVGIVDVLGLSDDRKIVPQCWSRIWRLERAFLPVSLR